MSSKAVLQAENEGLRLSIEAMRKELAELKARPPVPVGDHEHEFIPMPGEPYEKRSMDGQTMERALKYLSFYCRHCPATHEAVAADYRPKGAS